MFVTDFELKSAYVEGAKAAQERVSLHRNPFDDNQRDNWAKGYRAVVDGRFEPVSYLSVKASRELLNRFQNC